MNITATETHRIGPSVHLAITDDDGKDLYPGGRYVPATEWDDDPQKVVADIATYLATARSIPEPVLPGAATSCRMTEMEVADKLRPIADARDAQDALDVIDKANT